MHLAREDEDGRVGEHAVAGESGGGACDGGEAEET
jgi:hypothetical protein